MTATIARPDEARASADITETTGNPPHGPTRRLSYRTHPSPWQRRDALACGLLALLGVAGVMVCWYGATDEAIWRDQTRWLTGAILSTGLILLGGGLWVLIGLRRVRQGFRDLRRDQRAALGLTRKRGVGAEPSVASGDLVTATQMTRVHRADCILMRGKAPTPVTDSSGFGSCGVCGS